MPRPFPRIGVAVLLVGTAVSPGACANVWGIDNGLPFLDASADVGPDQGPLAEGGTPDAGPEGGGCVDDHEWCTTHCGMGPDNCGTLVGCGQCGANQVCEVEAGNVCGCLSDPNFCNNRCGMLFDNCDAGVICGGCPNGQTCNDGTCSGCTPESPSAACGSQPCNTATNNCGQSVYCGNNGSCEDMTQECIGDAGGSTCCTRGDDTLCGSKCTGTVTDSCGDTITCGSAVCTAMSEVCFMNQCCAPPTCNGCGASVSGCGMVLSCGCTGSAECVNGACCTPNATSCMSNCRDSCGVTVPPGTPCCPADGGGSSDGGSGVDGGAGCGGPGTLCTPGSCCGSLSCTSTSGDAGICT